MSEQKNKLRNIDKNSFLKTMHTKMIELVNENQSLLKEKVRLESSLRYYRTLEDKIKKIRVKNEEMQRKYDELVLEKEKELKDMKLRYENLIHEKEYELEKYKTNISIYNQKMNMVRQIEMENDIYKKEIQELKDKNEELARTTKDKLDDYEIQNKIKYNHLKLSMIEHLKEAKNKVTQLNLNYMDTNGRISVLQNQKLIASLESIQEQIDDYKEQNLKLMKKVKDLENDISLHKKIEINLTLKLKEKNNKDNFINRTLPNNDKKSNDISLPTFENSNYKSNTNSPPPLLNSSNFNSSSIKNLKKHTLINNKKNNMNLIISNSITSSDNEIDNFFRRNRREFNYKKYKLKLKEKDEKIENLELQVDKLNHIINSSLMKYKNLFNFIENCLNEFYHDEKLMNINSSINIDNIKKLEFNSLDKKDQYSILIILMNYLMNILTFNSFQKNTSKDPPFFATNLKYINTNFSFTKSNFNQLYIKNPFVKRNNKILNTFNSYRMNNNQMNFSISALNENSNSNDYRISDKKYKTLI